MWYDVSTLVRLLLCEGERHLRLFPALCTKRVCKYYNLCTYFYVLHVSQKHWTFTHWSVMLKSSDFRVRACEVNTLLVSVSFNGYHSVNKRLTTETMTGYLLQNQAEKLDTDVWYSLSRSCFFFLLLPSISPAPISCHFWQLPRTIH